MAFNQLTTTAVQLYDEWIKDADPRTKDWLLMSSPLPQTIIICAYIYFVMSLGPRLMENRKSFDLKKVLVIYNFSIVALSLYMCYETSSMPSSLQVLIALCKEQRFEALLQAQQEDHQAFQHQCSMSLRPGGTLKRRQFVMSGWGTGYSFHCDLVDYSHSPQAMRMAHTCWLYYFSKFIEMLDTVFFVLRKKNNQISFLHVFHHSIMPFTWWFGVRFAAGGLGTFHALLNCIVHVIMYTYYGLSALGPAYEKFLWWKKHLTSIQLTQFVIITTHIGQYFFMKDCPYQYPIFIYIIGLYGLVFLCLFLNFWYHAYTKGKRLPKVLRSEDKVQNNNGVPHNKRD